MNPENRRPILYRGERYIKPIKKGGGGPSKEPDISYESARSKIISDIETARSLIEKLPDELRLPNEFVVSLRLDPDFSAKSYYPETLFDTELRGKGVREVGSRIWRNEEDEEAGKMFFVRTTDEGLSKLEEKLRTPESSAKKNFMMDVRKLRSLDLLRPEEQILGIPEDWKEGRLEAVLHPFLQDNEVAFQHFLKLAKESGVDISKVRAKQYESGVTFVSLPGTRKLLKKIAGYNPLRTIHPLTLRKAPFNRVAIKSSAPKPPEEKEKPRVIMGIFDGGLQTGNQYTDPYSENIELTKVPADSGDIQHGTMVAGAALYGPINDFGSRDTLPRPAIAVRSFRVFPPDDEDQDLYEVIDMIENAVPEQKDISVYNISIGPYGPVLDDHISRFTFACDLLASKHNLLFCNAVGNIGDSASEYMRRIQSPSDMVNGLAVGAFTNINGEIKRSPYSCIGPGREGNKLKPDLSAFGGCDRTPLHLISTETGSKDATSGTSFASPMVASKAAQLIGYSGGAISSLVARAMLIHSAECPDNSGHNNELGHGILANNIEDIVTCKSSSFTLIYQGEQEYGKYTEFKIPWINEIKTGKVKFKWTSLVLASVDPQSPDDYTSGSTMLTFFAHSNKFVFKKGKETKTLDLNTEADEATALSMQGWEKNNFPVSSAGAKTYANEGDLRADMKWDTVDCRSESKLANSIFDPVFHIHALSRGSRYRGRKIRFAVVLTVELTDTSIDLYSRIISKYNLLVPISINVSSQVQVNA